LYLSSSFFYSCLPPDAAHFRPTTHRRAMKPGHPGATSFSPKQHPIIASSPLPLFPFPLTVPPPLLFDTASPPCSDLRPSPTLSPLHYPLRIPIALSSAGLDVTAVLTQSGFGARLEGWRPPHCRCLCRWSCNVRVAGVDVSRFFFVFCFSREWRGGRDWVGGAPISGQMKASSLWFVVGN
jgi:hypothetical protein